MWKIHYIVLCIICTVFGVLIFPVYLVLSVLFLMLTGFVLFYDLPLSVHVASIRFYFEWLYSSAVNSFQQSNHFPTSQRRQLQSNGIGKNHLGFFGDKPRSSPNLISRNKLCNEKELPDSFIMPLKNCNLHSTPLGLPKGEKERRRKSVNEVEESCSPSWCDQKTDSFSSKSVTRNVQSVAGPLLVSTRFNTNLNAELTADVSSMGFSSRVAQKGNARDGVTHQTKYSGIGVFPLVQLNSRSPKHSFSPRNSTAASKAVRVRIAPPDNSPFGGLENTVLNGSGDGDSMKSVLQVLKEMSRKRIHSQVEEEEDDKVKRQKKENYDENTPKTYLDGGVQNKRGRDDSPRSIEEVKRQRRQTNTTGSNEIMSSLSSSLTVKPPHLMTGTKRKAHVVDWSRSTTPVSGKILKVNVSPPNRISPKISPDEEKPATKSPKEDLKEAVVTGKSVVEVCEQADVDDKKIPSKNSIDIDETKGNECVRIEAGRRRVLARAGHVKEVPLEDINWHDKENDSVRINETAPSISLQRIRDPGRRLKDMLAAIDGSDEIDADVSSMSPSVIAILKTAKTSSKEKKSDSELIKSELQTIKSPVSILKTTSNNERLKTVTFCDQISVKDNNNQSLGSSVNLSPQTCLTTATVVSNSINVSISSSSETVQFGFGSLGSTYKNANSAQPNLMFATSSPTAVPSINESAPSLTPTSGAQSSQSQSPFGSLISSEAKSSPKSSPILLNTAVSTASNDIINKGVESTDIAKQNSPAAFTSFTFGKSVETAQSATSKSPSLGIFGINSMNSPKTESNNGNSISSPTTSVSTPITKLTSSSSPVNPLKAGTFAFNPSSKSFEFNTGKASDDRNINSEKSVTENSQKPQAAQFSFGSSHSANNGIGFNNSDKLNNPLFGGLGTSSNANTTNSTVSSSSSTPQSAPSPFIVSSSNTSANVSTAFSFGLSSKAANQGSSVFGSVTSQPSTQPNFFGGTTVSITPQTVANLPSTNSIQQQPNVFGNVIAQSNLTSQVSTTSSANSPPSFFSNTSSTDKAPAFGTNNVFGGNSNKLEGFGSTNVFGSSSAATSTAPSLFNNFISSPAQSGSFGATPSSTVSTFSSNPVVTSSTPIFGQITTSSSSSLFSFGSSTTTTQSPMFGNPEPLNTVTSAVNGPSSFSSFNNNTNNNPLSDNKTKQSVFGGSFQTPFSFGSSVPSTNTFSFGSSTNATTTASSAFSSPFKPPEPKPFSFEASQPSVQNPSAPVFAFGQNNSAQATAPTFQFNTASSSQPAVNSGAGGTPGGSAMFSIGSGSSSARPRTVSRARRTK
ncbi:uncharacterized protein LOC142319738 isoform X2 [Lycorma delicatula]|uniref:uncharacterized protein LOC142319738 isoform X2 n=1 Tax=Lycorma delicatula TaxID=130591 RepID=UPI003F518E9A